MLNMVLNFKQFMFDKSLRQNDLAQILGESQSVISLFVNGKRLPMKRHIDILEEAFGADVISQYMIDNDQYRDMVAKQATATIVPAEVVEEIKEEVAQAESVPILSEDLSTATDIDIRSYIDENARNAPQKNLPTHALPSGCPCP